MEGHEGDAAAGKERLRDAVQHDCATWSGGTAHNLTKRHCDVSAIANRSPRASREFSLARTLRFRCRMLRFKSDAEAAKLKQLMDMHAPK